MTHSQPSVTTSPAAPRQSAARPVVLIVTSAYLPGYRAGGPVRTLSNMVGWLGDEFCMKVLTRDRDLGSATPYEGLRPGVWHPVGKAQVRYLTPREWAPWKLAALLARESYDILYVDAILPTTSIITLLLHRLRLLPRRPLIVTPRGQLKPTALSRKPLKKQLFLRAVNAIGLYHGVTWHVTNPDEAVEVRRELGTRAARRVRAISNLPTPDVPGKPSAAQPKVPGTARIVFLSRISPTKNLHYALERLQNVSGRVEFDIYGILEDDAYWQRCRAVLDQLPPNVTAAYRGEVAFDRVVEVFSGYDLFLFPTLTENFGHVILEALLAGCPVLISDQTPWDAATLAGAGWVHALDRPGDFVQTLNAVVGMGSEDCAAMRQQAQACARRYIHDSQLVEQTSTFLHEVLRG